MCYAKPGPRCSAHVRTELEEAKQEWESNPTEATLRKLKRKEAEYDTTPEGQKLLRAQMEEDPNGSLILTTRLEQGIAKRKKALEAMKEGNGGLLPFNRIRRGLNDPNDPASREALEKLDEEARKQHSLLTEEDHKALHWYKQAGYEALNSTLVGGDGYKSFWQRVHTWYDDESRAEFFDFIEKERTVIDGIFDKVEKAEEPRPLYRIHRVHGKDIDSFLAKFEEGKEFTFRGYTSTSADADYMIQADLEDEYENSQERLEGRVVFEISTRSGVILHEASDQRSKGFWNITHDEREVLLAPGSRMRVVGVKKDVTYQSSRTSEDGSSIPAKQGFYKNGIRTKFAVVQLVEVNSH